MSQANDILDFIKRNCKVEVFIKGLKDGKNLGITALEIQNEYGILRMIVDKPAKAMEELEKAKFTVSLTKVIGVAIPDNAGGLSTVIELLAKQHISMEYIYAFTSRKIGEAIIILRVEDTSAAIDVLTNHDFKLLTHKEVLKE